MLDVSMLDVSMLVTWLRQRDSTARRFSFNSKRNKNKCAATKQCASLSGCSWHLLQLVPGQLAPAAADTWTAGTCCRWYLDSWHLLQLV